jgi:hypothetical protein
MRHHKELDVGLLFRLRMLMNGMVTVRFEMRASRCPVIATVADITEPRITGSKNC